MSGRSSTAAPLRGLAVVTMFRGEASQLREWVRRHLDAGADHLYVALDRPEPALLAALPEDPRVTWRPLGAETWERLYPASYANVERRQVDLARSLLAEATADGHAYGAYVDTDEVLDLAVPWADLAARDPGATAWLLPVREMWRVDGEAVDDPFGATVAVRPSATRGGWVRTLGWRAQYFRNGVLAHDTGKSVYRLPLAPGELTVHRPVDGPLAGGLVAVDDAEGRVLHHDSGSVATWNARWAGRVGGSTTATGLGGHRLAQQALFARELRRPAQEQARFFAEFFSLGTRLVDELVESGVAQVLEPGPGPAVPTPEPAPVPAAEPAAALQVLPDEPRTDLQLAMVCDENFVAPTFATLLSVLAALPETTTVRIVLLGDGLRPGHERRFRSLERCRPGVEVRLHDVTGHLDRDLGREAHLRSRATYARVYLVDHLPEQRTLYLDGDVLATRDISDLFALDIGEACLAGVTDSAAYRAMADPSGVPTEQMMKLLRMTDGDPRQYLNAGVLLLDVPKAGFRRAALAARGYVATHGRMLAQHDQDALNEAFRGRKHLLPPSFNYMTQFYTSERAVQDDLIPTKYAAADAALIHFSGKVKPWLAAEDEFYNGLYRRIVLAAERRLGVSCGFYFSAANPAERERWGTEQWAAALAGPAERPALAGRRPPRVGPRAGRVADLALVDVTDTALYLRFAAATHELAVAGGLRVVVRTTAGEELLAVPVSAFGPPLNDLRERVAAGVRRAELDLPALLAPHGGLVRGLSLALEAADGVRRVFAALDVLAAGGAALAEPAPPEADGEVTGIAEGRLRGWYRSAGGRPVALHLGGDLLAARVVEEKDGRRPFSFRLGHLLAQGYGATADPDEPVTVRLAGTNLALPGLRPTLAEARAILAEAASPAAPARGPLARLRGRTRR